MSTFTLKDKYNVPCPWNTSNEDMTIRVAYILRDRGYEVTVINYWTGQAISEVCDYDSDLDSRAHAVADWLEEIWVK